MVLILSISSDDAKFHENIFDPFQVIERTRFSNEKFRRAQVHKN